MLWRRRLPKKIAIIPIDFTGALIAKTKSSGVVVLVVKNGRVITYMTDIAEKDASSKYCAKQAQKALQKAQMSDLTLYEWENIGDNFEKLMFVHGGEFNSHMSCVK